MARVSNNAVTGTAVANDDAIVWPAKEKQEFDKLVRLRAWVDGQELQVRVEPAEEAWRYHRLKFYWGYLVEPFMRLTGYTKVETDRDVFKPACLPEGKHSLHDMDEEEMVQFLHDVEAFIVGEFPDFIVKAYQA